MIWKIQRDEPLRPGRKFVYLYKGKCPLFCAQGKSCGRGTQQALRRKTVSSPNSLLNQPRCRFLNVSTCTDVYRLCCPVTKAVSLPCSSLTLCAQLLFAMLVNLSLILPYFAYELQIQCGAEPSFEGMGTKMTLRLWCLTLGKNRPALSRAATSWK